MDVEIQTKIPSDIHPGTMAPLGKGPEIDAATMGLEAVYVGFAKIFEADKNVKDKTALFQPAMEVAENSIRHAGGALDRIKKAIADHEAAITASLALPADAKNYANEIRAHFKAEKSPATAIIKAIRDGDVSVAGAVLQGPAFLSGLTPEQQAQVRKVAAHQFAGQQVANLERAMKAKAKVERAIEWATEEMVKAKAAWVPDTGALVKLKERMAK